MTINIEYEAEKKLNLPYESIIEDVVNASLDYEKCPYEAEVNVILTDNAEIRRINREFRQIDSPTDVLSFPMGEDGKYDIDPATNAKILGDIVISMEKAVEQAERFGHTLQREVGYLTAHSMLHLLGYDHEEPLEKVHMREKEELVMTQLGLPSTTSYVLNSDEE